MGDRYDRGSSRRRGALGQWVPLALTLTIATISVAAWAWSHRQRDDDDYDGEDEHEHEHEHRQERQDRQDRMLAELDYDHADYGDNPPYGVSGTDAIGGLGSGLRRNPQSRDNLSAVSAPSAVSGWSACVSGALGGGASPQQWVDNASRAVSAGVAAASAAVGGALASIREGDKDPYADHEAWSEEADTRKKRASRADTATPGASSTNSRKRKTVAIVVSADGHLDGSLDDGFHEHASILSYIPRQHNFSRVRVFVLIHAPGLAEASSLEPGSLHQQPASLSSSFSNIAATELAQSPKADKAAPSTAASAAHAAYHAVHAQALALVEKDSDIIPYTSSNGHVHILHLLEPDVVYLQESLTGDNGAAVNQLQTWMHNDVVVVVGAESGYGGLADSDSEAERPDGDSGVVPRKWWQREDRVGRGRGIVVVDVSRVNDDWVRRVQGHD